MNECDLSDAVTETVSGALYRNYILRWRWVSARKWRSEQLSLQMQTEGSQRRRRPNTGCQGIPGTCSSHRKRSVFLLNVDTTGVELIGIHLSLESMQCHLR